METQSVIPTVDSAAVFQISVDVEEQNLFVLKELLSDDERMRADRFRQAVDRRRFVVARANLRKILSSMLGCSAAQVAFQYGQFGKPELCSAFGSSIQFNVSHSGNWALIGIAIEAAIGVDIEEVREVKDISSVVRSTFAASEFQQWLAISSPLQTEAFFRAWTCKEALIKALGTGVSVPTNTVVVEVDPSKPARLHYVDLPSQSNVQWRLETFTPASGYCAAIVCDSRVATIQTIILSPV